MCGYTVNQIALEQPKGAQFCKFYTSEVNMPTKLTLRRDENLIASAKACAETQCRSVLVLEPNYFDPLTHQVSPMDASPSL